MTATSITPVKALNKAYRKVKPVRREIDYFKQNTGKAEHDVLAYKGFPREHWSQLHSTNPLERLNKEIKRRTRVVGIFPNDPAIVRLVGAMML